MSGREASCYFSNTIYPPLILQSNMIFIAIILCYAITNYGRHRCNAYDWELPNTPGITRFSVLPFDIRYTKCPSLRARYLLVCRLRACVIHRHIHYHYDWELPNTPGITRFSVLPFDIRYTKCPSLRARYLLVCRLRACVIHRHIHYRRRFSVLASIIIWRLLTLDEHCVNIWLKDVVLICCIICANTRTYSHTTTISWQIRNFIFWLTLRVYDVCVILTVHLVRA